MGSEAIGTFITWARSKPKQLYSFFSFALSNFIAQASDYCLDLKCLAITQRQVQMRFLDSTHMHIHTLFQSTLLACRSQQELKAVSASNHVQHSAECGPLSLFSPLYLLSSLFASPTNSVPLQQKIPSKKHWCLLSSFLEVLYSLYTQVTKCSFYILYHQF